MTNLAVESGVAPEPTLFDLRAEHTNLLGAVRSDPSRITTSAGEVRGFVERARKAGAYLFENEQRVAAQGLIDFWTTTLYRASIPCEEVELVEFDTSHAPGVECPYVGLEAFRETQSRFFFGREQVLKDGLEKLRSGGGGLIAVLGPSGSGKSSLVLAGLLPRLKGGADLPGSARWRYLPPIVPGSDPLQALAVALRQDESTGSADEIAQRLRRRHDTLARIAVLDPRPLVVTIDQFEELFTLCEDSEARDAFAANLVSLVKGSGGHIALITMRDDREPHLAKYPDLRELFKKGDVRVMTMTRAELREAIERPAGAAHIRLENGLADAIADDLVAEPAALPLLQFTLRKLWESRAGNWLRLTTYRELGGARAALGNAAHKLFESFTEESRGTLRRVMLRMVRPGLREETTSSRVRVSDLMAMPHSSPPAVEYVLAKLLEARLIRRTTGETPGDDQVEVAHEALIRNWAELVAWVQEARADLVDLRRLEALAEQWDRRGRWGGLLDERQLNDAETWLKENDVTDLGVNPALNDLVALSRASITARKAAERTARIWWRVLVTGLIVALAGVAVFLWLAVRAGNAQLKAERRAKHEAQVAALAAGEAAKVSAAVWATVAETATKRGIDEGARLRLRNASTEEQIADLKNNVLVPLQTENARLRSQLQTQQVALDRLTENSELLTAVRSALATQKVENGKLKALLEAQQDSMRDKDDALEKLRRQPSSAPQPAVYEVWSRPLLIGHTVLTTTAGAEPAGVCCFLNNNGQHFLVSTAKALSGSPGDLVIVRGDDGRDYRVGNLWVTVDGAAVARLLSGVRLPRLTPGDPKEFQGTASPHYGLVTVILRESQPEGRLVDFNTRTATLQIHLTPASKGAPVIDKERHLIGLVTDVGPERATVTLIGPLSPLMHVKHEGWKLYD